MKPIFQGGSTRLAIKNIFLRLDTKSLEDILHGLDKLHDSALEKDEHFVADGIQETANDIFAQLKDQGVELDSET